MSDAATTPPDSGVTALIGRARERLEERKELKRFIKFGMVGVIGFIIDFTVSNVLWSVLPESLTLALPFGIELTRVSVGGTIGFLAAITSNFLWNRFWTYPDSRSKSPFIQYGMFVSINSIGLLFRIPILELTSPLYINLVSTLLPGIGITTLAFLGAGIGERIGKNLALVTAVVIVMFWNFFVNRYLTYNDVD